MYQQSLQTEQSNVLKITTSARCGGTLSVILAVRRMRQEPELHSETLTQNLKKPTPKERKNQRSRRGKNMPLKKRMMPFFPSMRFLQSSFFLSPFILSFDFYNL
jgi:hypothetical protein